MTQIIFDKSVANVNSACVRYLNESIGILCPRLYVQGRGLASELVVQARSKIKSAE